MGQVLGALADAARHVLELVTGVVGLWRLAQSYAKETDRKVKTWMEEDTVQKQVQDKSAACKEILAKKRTASQIDDDCKSYPPDAQREAYEVEAYLRVKGQW